MPSKILNLLLYQAGWFACVLGGAAGRPWWFAGTGLALGLTALHVALARERAVEVRLILAAGLLGWVVDCAQSAAGLLTYASGWQVPWLAPAFDAALWMQFATLLRHSLGWLRGRYFLASVLGAVGGPVAFTAGARLGAVAFHVEAWRSLLALAVVWAAAMPVLVHLAWREGGDASGYRWQWSRNARREA